MIRIGIIKDRHEFNLGSWRFIYHNKIRLKKIKIIWPGREYGKVFYYLVDLSEADSIRL